MNEDIDCVCEQDKIKDCNDEENVMCDNKEINNDDINEDERNGLYSNEEINDAITKLAFMLIVNDNLGDTEKQFNKSTYISKTDEEIVIRIKL